MKRRILAFLLAIVTLFGSMPISAFATGENGAGDTMSTELTGVPAATEFVADETNELADPIDTSISLDSHTLHVTAAEGVFPNGAVVQAKLHQSFEIGDILSNTVSNLELFAAFDIQVVDADGTAVQPNGAVSVKIHTPDSLYGMEGATVRVYYVDFAEATATEIPCQVDFETGMVSFTADHFSTYAVTVSDVPECICENQCAADAPNMECPVCSRNVEVCWGSAAILSVEELAALFAALPESGSITAETPQEQKDAIALQLEAAMNAYYALMDADFDTCTLFEQEYEDLIRNAQRLDEVLTGNSWISYAGAYDVAYNPQSNKNATITLSADVVDEAPVVVRYDDSGNPILYEVVKITGADRTYAFTRDNTSGGFFGIGAKYYQISGTSVTGARYQHTMIASDSAITLAAVNNMPETQDFKLFYLYSNEMAQPYYNSIDNDDLYGPSGNNEPFVIVNVNLAALKNSPYVTIGTSNKTHWFVSANLDDNGRVSLENAQAFWNVIKNNMNEDSQTKLMNTGLWDEYVGYILKYQSNYYHGDGILHTEERPYVAELHTVENGQTVYFGSVVGSDKRFTDVLDLCDQNLGGEVTWDTENPTGESIGYFYKTEDHVQTTIKVTVTQMDSSNNFVSPTGSDIRYIQQSNGHYLARYKMETQVSTKTNVSVTYTDGGEGVFTNVTYPYVLETQRFPTFNGSTDREGYTFLGWKYSADANPDAIHTDVSALTVPDGVSSVTLTAQWAPMTYTVIWKDSDGTELERDEQVSYGSVPTYDHPLPNAKVQTGYDEVFTGWSPAVTKVSGDPSVPIVYTAVYAQVPHQYNIIWKNYDGTVLETDTDVNYGTTPAYNGTIPQRAKDDQYTYEFSGWSPDISQVTGYQEYVAQYQKTVRNYTVTWTDDSGKVLKTDLNVPYGTTPSYGSENPDKADTDEFTYHFKGWTPTVAAITGDTTYRAEYTAVKRSYTVTWMNGDTVLETDTVEYGAMPKYDGERPSKEGDGQYSYAFDKWSPTVVSVSGDAVYKATFVQTVNEYTVTWNYQGTDKQEIDRNVPFGTALEFNHWDDLDYESANYTYAFSGWKLEGDSTNTIYKTAQEVGQLTVGGNMTLTAQYNATRKGYDITVKVIVDPVLNNGNLVSGTQMSLEEVLGAQDQPRKLYLKGMGTKAYELVYNSTTKNYVATLVPDGEYSLYMGDNMDEPISPYTLLVEGMNRERNLYYYSVTYDPNGGTMSGAAVSYHRGNVTVTNTVPTKAGNTFLGWQVEGTDQVLKAGDTITADIQKPYKLIALWGNIRVDVRVTMNHAIFKDNGELQGRDQHPGDLNIHLVYRDAQNPDEDYVEVVGAQDLSYAASTYYDASHPDSSQVTVENVYTGLDNRFVYSAAAILSGYTVQSRTVTKVAGEDNHYIVDVVLQYNPEMFTLSYEVEAESTIPEDMIPSAVDVKLLYLHEGHWDTIAAHDHYSVDVEIDETRNAEDYPRFGTGSYPAPVFDADKNTRYYRVAAVGFTVGEGNDAVEMTATGGSAENAWVFTSNAAPGKYSEGAYTATLTFTAENDNHQGAHGTARDTGNGIVYDQHGALKLLVKAHPTTLKLQYNDGTGNTYQTVDNLFVVPDLTSYVPVRAGYTFMGWYSDAACTTKAKAGDYLNLSNGAENMLYAKWNADITVTGTVYVANSYIYDGELHNLYDQNLLQQVTVRVLNAQGLQVKAQSVTITYPKDSEGKVTGFGSATYQISGIPNDGTAYTVDILQSAASYYTALYQNEVDNLSLDQATDYSKYYANRNRAELGTNEPETATVNALMQFTPVNFNLHYTVDASGIGENFRPDKVSALVFFDSDVSEAFSWKVISQMINAAGYSGQETAIDAGVGGNSFPVWRNFGDGTLYNYAVVLDQVHYWPEGTGTAVTAEVGTNYQFPDAIPFTVRHDPQFTYYAPDSNATGGDADQAHVLKLILEPKNYSVTYVTGGGTMPETYPTVHTWSKITDLTGIEPQRAGYTFAGWYQDAGLTEKVTAIDAKVRSATTLYAKWTADAFGITYDLNGGSEPGNPTSYTIETDSFVLKHPTREGYTFQGWTGTGTATVTRDVAVPKGSTGDRSYLAHWEQNRYTIAVTVSNGSRTPVGDITVLHGENQTIQFAPKSASYVLDTVTVDGQPAQLTGNGSYTFENVTGNHTIDVVYSEDSNQNGTPDCYEARVTYQVQNGSFAAGEHTSQDKLSRQYTIPLRKNVNGVWVDITPAPTLKGTIPTVADGDLIPNAGYHDHGHWRETFDENTVVSGDATYLFHFNERITYYIQYYPTGQMVNPQYTSGIYHGTDITVDPNGGKWTYTWENATTATYTQAYDFQLDQNMHLGAAQREHYVFDGWEYSSNAEGTAHVYKAKWRPEEFTITYHMPYGYLHEANRGSYTVETETFTLNNPIREGYTFQGWQLKGENTPSTNVVIPHGSSGNREYTAVWQANTNTPYTVRYFFEVLNPGTAEDKYAEDAQLQASLSLTGETDTQVHLTPAQMPDIPHYDVNNALSTISGNVAGNGQLVLSVYYDRESYEVTWVNEGTTVETDTVKYGALPSFDQAAPTKEGDAQYSYSFTGWDNAIDQPITQKTIFTAQYAQSINTYTITWLNEDGSLLDTDTVAYGETPNYTGATPVKAPSARYVYTFDTWTPAIIPVTGDKTYTATYTVTDRLYTATVQFRVNGENATATDMANSLGTNQLYLGTVADAPQYTLLLSVDGSDGLYKAMVPVGNYQVYIGNETSKTRISNNITLSIVNTAASAQVDYYTVRYYTGYGQDKGELLDTNYLLKGSHAHVDFTPNPTRGNAGEWYFKGWKMNDALYHHEDHLSDGITAPMELIAQWSNVKVNLAVTLKHGSDEHTEARNLDIRLAYKAKGVNEDYVEVVASLLQKPFTRQNGNSETRLEFNDLYTGLNDDFEYSNTVYLHNYVVTSRTAGYDSQENAYNVSITLEYKPNLFELRYGVDATGITTSQATQWLVPKAVDVKVMHYNATKWEAISALEDHSVEVALDAGKTGTGSYEVPQTDGNANLAQYWVDAVGLTVWDAHGNEIEMTASQVAGAPWTYRSNAVAGKYPQGAYTIESVFKPGTTGAQYDANGQSQEIKLTVLAHPATVVLHANDNSGSSQTIENLFTLPNLAEYAPTRSGYTFQGWALETESHLTTIATGDVLEAGKTYNFYAQWKQNLTIKGTLTASNYYNGDKLLEGERIKSATVFLYKDDQLRGQVGTPITVSMIEDNDVRRGTYQITDLPNDGSQYYIVVSAPGFSIDYSNGAAQSTLPENYAVFAGNATTAVVDANLAFAPQSFNLAYAVDVKALGKDFWPKNPTVLVMADTDHTVSYKWETIIQMADGGEPIAIDAATGIGEDSYPVWQYHASGYAYNYAIRLEKLPLDINGDGVIQPQEELTTGIDGSPNALPIQVRYDYPAYYKAIEPHQSQLLKATVTPKQSTITLNAAGGTLTLKDAQGNAQSGNTVVHTWSHPTVQALEISRDGYYFEGWADENGTILSASLAASDSNNATLAADGTGLTVGAAVYGDVTLTAVWTKIQTVNFRGGDRIITYNGQDQTVEFAVYSDLPAGYSFSGITCSATGKNVADAWEINFTEAAGGIRIFNESNEDVTHLFAVGTKTPGTLAVYPAVLTVKAIDKTKSYDGQAADGFACQLDGFLGADTQSVINGSVSYDIGAVEAVTPGTYTITPVVTGLSADNYIFAPVSGKLTIEKAVLTATLTAESKEYDGTDEVNQYVVTIQGKVGSDDIGISVGDIYFAGKNAGSHTVTATNLSLTGADADFYDLQITKLETTAEITVKPMTVWLSPVSRKYDGTQKVNIVFRTATGLLQNDHVSVIDVPSEGTLSGSKDAGNGKIVTVANEPTLSGADAGNYKLQCQVDKVDILPRSVILTTESADKLYDGAPLTALGYSVSGDGFVDGEVTNLRTVGSVVGSNDGAESQPNEITYDKQTGYEDMNYNVTSYLGVLTVYPDKNGNGVSDTTENRYSVTYLAVDTDMSNPVEHVDLLTGMDIPAPPTGVKASNDNGYVVAGWKCISGNPGADNKLAEESLIYQAVLEARTFAITYDAAGGTMPVLYPQTYTYGNGIAEFVTPTRENYVFAGWYLDGQTPITSISQNAYGDKTLVAKWEEDKLTDGIPDKYQVLVTYKVENGSWADNSKEDISCVYTLYEKGVDGNWTKLQNVTLGNRIPTGMKHGEGYDTAKPGSWSTGITADTLVPETGATYTFTFGERVKYNLTVSVLGGSAKVNDTAYEKPVTILHGDDAVAAFAPNEGYILDSAVIVTTDGTADITLDNGIYRLTNVTEDATIRVCYSPDQWNDKTDELAAPDGIPDSRQAVFHFQVSGTDGNLTGKTTQVVTLQKNQNEEYAANVTPETVTVTPAPTYRLEKWVDANGAVVADPFASRLVQGGSQYVYTASFIQQNADVHYMDADKLENNAPQSDKKTVLVDKVVLVDPNGGSWCGSTESQKIVVVQDITLDTPVREGYLFRGWKCESGNGMRRSVEEIAYIFIAQWLEDSTGNESDVGNGDDEDNTSGDVNDDSNVNAGDGEDNVTGDANVGDGIPDIYQKKVIFRIENGTWDASGLNDTDKEIVCYLTLTDAQGNWSETGTAQLAPLVPTGMQPKQGYYNGKWDTTPPDYVSDTAAVTYTYRFEEKPSMTPETGDGNAIHMWFMTMFAAMAAVVCLIRNDWRKKRTHGK